LQKINITIQNLLYGLTEISVFPNTRQLSVGVKIDTLLNVMI